MPLKTPGKLNLPPPQATFDELPLESWCGQRSGVYYRLHSRAPATGKPWPPIHFSQSGRSRFDPVDGPGTLYLGETLAAALLEVFDDSWGPVNASSRRLTLTQLGEWWVTLVAVPTVNLFYAHGINLSKIGTDNQLLSGDHAVARQWALALVKHPLKIDGIYYPSRHHAGERNLAIFNQRGWSPAQPDKTLLPPAAKHRKRKILPGGPMFCGPPVLLRDHPELKSVLIELEVAVLP
jgi:RES domain-containing protein